MRQDAEAAPCDRPAETVEEGAVPAPTAFQIRDPAFRAGPPLDQPDETAAMLDGPTGRRRLAFAGDDHVLHPKITERLVDLRLAVSPVRGDRAGCPAGQLFDPGDRGGEQGGIGGVALVNRVVENDPVDVVKTTCAL